MRKNAGGKKMKILPLNWDSYFHLPRTWNRSRTENHRNQFQNSKNKHLVLNDSKTFLLKSLKSLKEVMNLANMFHLRKRIRGTFSRATFIRMNHRNFDWMKRSRILFLWTISRSLHPINNCSKSSPQAIKKRINFFFFFFFEDFTLIRQLMFPKKCFFTQVIEAKTVSTSSGTRPSVRVSVRIDRIPVLFRRVLYLFIYLLFFYNSISLRCA